MSTKKKSPGRGDHPVRQLVVFFHNTALQISALWLFRAGADGEKRITDEDWWLEQRSKLLPEVLRMGQLARGINRHLTSAFRHPVEFETKIVALLNDLRDYCVWFVAPGPVDDAMSRKVRLLHEHCQRYASRLDEVPITGDGSVVDEEYQSAQWFSLNTKIPPARLRQAANPDRKTKHVRKQIIDGVECYSVDDARYWWPSDMKRA